MDATVRNRKHGCQTEKEGMPAGKGQDVCWERENNREEKDNVQRYEIGQNESKKAIHLTQQAWKTTSKQRLLSVVRQRKRHRFDKGILSP